MRTLQQARTVSAKAHPILRECKRLIQRFVPEATVLVYGSVARGTAGTESDYDILVLSDEPLTSAEEERLSDALYELELERGVVLSVLFYAIEQWNDPLHRVMPLHREVEREGIVL